MSEKKIGDRINAVLVLALGFLIIAAGLAYGGTAGRFNTSGGFLGGSTFTLTADGTTTATYIGADAAGAANTTLDTTGAGSIIIGSADVLSLTVTTDNTGNGEVVLPNGSIGSAEILDQTIGLVDVANTLVLDAQLVLTSGAAEGIAMTHAMTNDTTETAHSITVTASDTGAATTAQYGLYLDNVDSTEPVDALLVIDQSDADVAEVIPA